MTKKEIIELARRVGIVEVKHKGDVLYVAKDLQWKRNNRRRGLVLTVFEFKWVDVDDVVEVYKKFERVFNDFELEVIINAKSKLGISRVLV